jgi:hypothetical protein
MFRCGIIENYEAAHNKKEIEKAEQFPRLKYIQGFATYMM